MSRTYNHSNKKSSWKTSCKKTTNRRIRYTKYFETAGLDERALFEMERIVIKNIENLTSQEAQELFDYIDLHKQETVSIVPNVTKYRFWMD